MDHLATASTCTLPGGDRVSTLWIRPPQARLLLVLGHGAGAGMRHATMERMAQRLADEGIATMRYQFPYMERGGRGRDAREVTLATVRAAVARAHEEAPSVMLLAGGHSFGGRMTSLAAADAPLDHVRGLVFFAFPLHPAGKPGTERAAHLPDVTVPLLFVSGTRDRLARLDLLQSICDRLGTHATLHLLDTADHSYRVLKRTRSSEVDVFVEMAQAARDWSARVT